MRISASSASNMSAFANSSDKYVLKVHRDKDGVSIDLMEKWEINLSLYDSAKNIKR